MIRILHIADVHLGVESYGRVDPATGLNTRLSDFTSCLDEAVSHAINEGVDIVVFAGDAYRSRDPSQTHQREFAKRVKRLADAQIPVFLLVGNHDVPMGIGRANSVDIFETLRVSNVHVGRLPDLHVIETKKGPVQIVAVPWLTKNRFLTADECKGKTSDDLNRLMEEKLTTFIENAARELDSEIPAVLVAHANVMGAVWGSERSVTLGQDFVLLKSAFINKGFDYVALGHVHKHQVLGNNPPIIYSGSINRIDFGEEKEEKGFVVVDIAKKGSVTYRFTPVNARRFVTIEVRADSDDPTEKIINVIERHRIEDAVVRLVLTATPEAEAKVRYPEVRKALRNAYYVAGIVRRVEEPQRHTFAGRLVEEMTPREALQVYLKNKEVPEDRQRVLLQYAEGLMEGLA